MGTGEQQKLQRLAELEVRIKDLDVGVKSSQSETAGFIQSVNQQLEQFEWMKNREIGTFLIHFIFHRGPQAILFAGRTLGVHIGCPWILMDGFKKP